MAVFRSGILWEVIRKNTRPHLGIVNSHSKYLLIIKGEEMLTKYRYLIAVTTTIVLIGCSATLPNVKPLVESSIELKDSNDAVFRSIENTSMAIYDQLPTDDDKKKYKEAADTLKAESAVRIIFLTEVVEYSLALNEIINKTEEKNKKIADLANKIDTFLNAAEKNSSAAGPYAPMITGSAEAAKIINSLVKEGRIVANNIRTLESLDEAVKAAGPLFEKIASTFKDDLVSLSNLNATAVNTFLGAYRISHKTEFNYRQALLKHRDEILEDMMTKYGVDKNKEFHAAYAARDGVWGGKRNYEILQSIHKQLDLSEETFSQYDREKAVGKSKILITNQLIKKTDETLDAFGKAHRQLAQAIKNGVSVDLTRLSEYAKQLKELQEQLRKL